MNILEYAIAKKMFGGSGGGATAYHLSSADELPTDAVDGSLAVVESDSLVGEWEAPEVGNRLDFSALRLSNSSYSDVLFSFYEDELIAETEDWWWITTDEDGNVKIETPNFGRIYDDTDGGVLNSMGHLFVYTDVQEMNSDDFNKFDFKTFFNTNFKRISGGHTLYARENGEWVNKGEI